MYTTYPIIETNNNNYYGRTRRSMGKNKKQSSPSPSASDNSSNSSNSSRLSIKIPRGPDKDGNNEGPHDEQSVEEYAQEPSDTAGKSSSLASEENSEKASKSKGKRKPGGRRSQEDDSEESAYSESGSEEETDSEEVYSEEEEESESAESEEYEEDESEEEWDDRRKKYVKRGSRARPSSASFNYQKFANPLVPMQYSGVAGFAPIAPMPPSMASIPMFARFAASQKPIPSSSRVTDVEHEGNNEDKKEGEAKEPIAVTEATAAAVEDQNEQLASASIQVGSSNLTPEQLQEIARKTAASLVSGASGPARIMLPRNPDGSIVQPSPELKQAVASMLVASPEWRQALLTKLQMNQKITAEQAAKMGLAAPPSNMATAGVFSSMMPMMRPPMGVRPIVPLPMMRPQPFTGVSTMTRSVERKKRGRKSSSTSQLVSPTSGEDAPLAARRERRTPRKAVDYSKFFKDEGADEEEEEELGVSDNEDSDDVSRSRKRKVSSFSRRPRPTYSSDNDEGEESSDDEKGFEDSTSSEDVGVEKILSYRINDEGKKEFYVKFHNLSYIHCEWIGEEEMMMESMGNSRIKKFLSKPLSMRHYSDKYIFNPEFTEVERVVHGWEHADEDNPAEPTWSFLVKWAGLPYSEASWEKRSTLEALPDGPDRLKEFEARPTLEYRRANTASAGFRPDRASYNKLETSPVYKGGNTLRPYQLEGLNWLVYCWINRQSCIIADEMGLGKTVQSVSFLDLLYSRYAVRGPFLIVAPLSTIPHWQREFEAWTNLNCIIYHGDIASREMMKEYEFYYKNEEDQPIMQGEFCKFDVLITTYEMALAGFEHLQPINWRVAVFDEAHRLKNRASKATETLKALQIEHKVLLTGTPLQNNVEELWSLLNFLQPQRFFSEGQFLEEYGNLRRGEDVIRLQELLKPLMLRRLKEDVETSIPVKEETVIEVELTAVQKRYYRAILERNFAFLTKGCAGSNAPNLINAMMELRKCCIHPYLIKGAEERILTECNAHSMEEQMLCMIQASGKLVLVDKLLRRLRDNGHKVLIFSQMTRCLDILVDYLKWRDYPFERIDGAIRGDLRQAAIDRFCNPNSDSFVFLLCTRAGGVGINLTAADTVVIFDSDWNPQNDIQAQARCHRIGQTKSVKVYRLLTRNTYEREMFDKAGLKLGLDRAVLQKMRPEEELQEDSTAAHNPQLSKKEVETLLKKGAYGLLMENDEDAIRFCEEDIDQILERRTTVIRHEAGKTSAEPGGSIFSKASFAATADDMDIDIDDPNFWELWARRLDLDPRQLLSSSGVVVDEPRIKRQTRRLRQEDLSLDELGNFLQGELSQDDATLASQPSSTVTKGKKSKVKPVEPTYWTGKERAKFIKQLLSFGIHRFDDWLSLFPNRSKNDLIACARAIIKLCLESVNAVDGEEEEKSLGAEEQRFREDCEKLLLAHLDFDRTSVVMEEAVDQSTGEIDLAAAETGLQEAEETHPSRQREFSKADIPYAGAGRKQILEFKSFLGEMPEGLLVLLKSNCRKILLRLQLLDFIRQLVESHATVVAKKKAPVGRRQKDATATEADEIEYHLPVPPIMGTAPVRGWSKALDEALVVGVFRHGYDAYDAMRTDQKLAFSIESWANPDLQKEENSEAAPMLWPEASVLNERLKKIVLAMEKRTQAAAKLAIQASKANAEGLSGGRRRTTANIMAGEDETYQAEDDEEYAGRRRRTAKTTRGGSLPNKVKKELRRKTARTDEEGEGSTTRWTKKDKAEFQRIVTSYGLPSMKEGDNIGGGEGRRDWSRFSQLGTFSAAITKNIENTLEEYCDVFLKSCKVAASKRGRKSGEEEEEELYQEETELPPKTTKDAAATTAPPITTDRAKKILARIDLMDKLRQQILSLSDLVSYLGRARKTGGLPTWWITPDHDAALLMGVGKYGFGRWDLLVADLELPFREIYGDVDPDGLEKFKSAKSEVASVSPSSIVTGRGARRRQKTTGDDNKESNQTPTLNLALISWPQESVLVRRVETIMETIINEERRRTEPPLETKKRGRGASGGGGGGPKKKQKSLLEYGMSKSTSKEEADREEETDTAS